MVYLQIKMVAIASDGATHCVQQGRAVFKTSLSSFMVQSLLNQAFSGYSGSDALC